jgi:hypothetical protein
MTKRAFLHKLRAIFPAVADAWDDFRMLKQVRKWRRTGWKTPLNGFMKRFIIKAETRRLGAQCLVETGTLHGETVWFFRDELQKIFSVEIDPTLASAARERFRSFPHIEIIEGDSADKIADIVSRIPGACVFWLDGHYSSGDTGRGATDCPLWKELDAIATGLRHPFTILIDDARNFDTDPAYPKMQDLASYGARHFPDHLLKIENDIVHLVPRSLVS